MQELRKHPELLAEWGQLFEKLQQNLKFPPARRESRLLPVLPESTMSYAAIPNYGDAAHQLLKIFRQELQESSVLRDWWRRGDLATAGPKIEDFLEKFSQLSQYLGDEIVVSGAMEGRDPSLLIVAEVRKPGLKKFLQQLVTETAGKSKPDVLVLDPQELASAKAAVPGQELTLLVRPDYVVAALDLPALRKFNSHLDQSVRAFVSTPFGKRVARAYEDGVTILAAADLHKILSLVPPGTQASQLDFQRSGFADMKYLVWQHNTVGSQTVSQAELSFTGPRHGPASWLAKPAPLGSLDFVSPKAMLSLTLLLANPAQIFDELKELATASNPNAFASVSAIEQLLNLNLRQDLLSHLGGEVTVELDNITPPLPVWKAYLKVTDPRLLQQTLNALLTATHIPDEQFEEGGLAYHALRIPSSPASVQIGYAFVDGYLTIASSHEALAEAVRLHRSGESLGKSKKFLASLPPNHPQGASALFYQDPIAITTLQLRQFAPDMADSLAQFAKESTPAVICVYGDESAIREASKSGALDVGAALVVGAIAIPNLLRSKIAANEASAVGSVRTVNTAQVTYAAMFPQRGYAPNLATFGADPHGPAAGSADHAGLLDETLANDTCTADAWCTKSGYRFRVTSLCKQHACNEYVVLATPADGNTGTRNFCSTSDGVIHFKPGPPLPAPVSVSECRAWPPLQ
jgi:hypothetical protein